jgi:DNA mismatch repair protein MSH3
MLDVEATKAFSAFLNEIAQGHYGVLRNAVQNLAIADCLLSLARVALQEGYSRPEFTDDDTLEIVEGLHSSVLRPFSKLTGFVGRHPMVEALRSDPFVPNSVTMGNKESRSKGVRFYCHSSLMCSVR